MGITHQHGFEVFIQDLESSALYHFLELLHVDFRHSFPAKLFDMNQVFSVACFDEIEWILTSLVQMFEGFQGNRDIPINGFLRPWLFVRFHIWRMLFSLHLLGHLVSGPLQANGHNLRDRVSLVYHWDVDWSLSDGICWQDIWRSKHTSTRIHPVAFSHVFDPIS